MIRKEQIEKFEKELKIEELSEEMKEIFKEMKKFTLKAIKDRAVFIEKRRIDPYQSELNKLNSKITYARKKNQTDKLKILEAEKICLQNKYNKSIDKSDF